MKKIIAICLTTLILLSQANGNIVDKLTELNNLYKSGAINEDEFSKAKNILLKLEVDEKSNIEEKVTIEKNVEKEEKETTQIIEIKATNKDLKREDLSKTFVSKKELEEIGQYKELKKYPAGLFKNPNFSESMLAKKSAEEMYKTFVQHKNLNEKYPENMMRAMAYFEVFYNHKIKEEKKAIEDYQNNYPNVKKSSKKAIQSLYSLSQAKESMRKSIGLTSNDNLEDALTGYMHMYDFMSQGIKSQNKLTIEEKKIKKESTKFKSSYGAFKKNLELKLEQRISQKEFEKEFKKTFKNVQKSLKKINKINPNKYSVYKNIDEIFKKSLDIIENCNKNCEDNDLITAIDSVDFSNAILKDVEKNIIKKKFDNNLSQINIENVSDDTKKTLTLASLSSKKQNNQNILNLQKQALNLANNDFAVDEIVENIQKDGYQFSPLKIAYQNLEEMENWEIKDWANSWKGDLPVDNFKDKAGNLIELTSENIDDIKAQLARNEFQNLINFNETDLSNDLNQNLIDIAKSVQDNPSFDVENWLNQDFSITLDNYTKIAAESIISEFGDSLDQETINDIRANANFDNLTKLVNSEYGTNMTSEEYANIWQNATIDGSTSNWGDVTAGVDLISQVGSFEAASIAKDLGTDLQTVADSIALAATVGVSTDLEAAASGLGYDSFADAVSAYNKQHGTNYSVDEAKEALGQ
ncbi:SHOCT domain-containing protein [Candidatus Pelagibacter sp.]|nr:SHOCT domain-containing protein [Candidatus Pelagibacter sp.]